MPRYKVTSPDGMTVVVSGDAPPTDEDLDQIFSEAKAIKAERESVSIPAEIGKGIVRGAARAVAAVPAMAGAVADTIRSNFSDGTAPGDVQVGGEKSILTEAADAIVGAADKAFPSKAPDSFWLNDVPEGLGQFGGALLGGAAGAIAKKGMGVATGVAMGAAGEVTDAYQRELDRQKEAGEPESANKALAKGAAYGAVAGAIESGLGVGRVLRNFERALAGGFQFKGVKALVFNRLKDTAAGFTEESAQRAVQDLIVDGQLSPEAIAHEGGVGAVVQGILGIPVDVVGARRVADAGMPATAEALTQQVDAVNEIAGTETPVVPVQDPPQQEQAQPQVAEAPAIQGGEQVEEGQKVQEEQVLVEPDRTAPAPGERTQESQGAFLGQVTQDTDAGWNKQADQWIASFPTELDAARAINDPTGNLNPEVREYALAKLIERTQKRVEEAVSDIERLEADNLLGRLSELSVQSGAQSGKALVARKLALERLAPLSGVLAYKRLMRERQTEALPQPVRGAFDPIRETVRQSRQQAIAELPRNIDKAAMMLLKKAGVADGVNWNQLFQDATGNQEERRGKLLEKINADPLLAKLTNDERAQLAKALDRAWERVREAVAKRNIAVLSRQLNLKPIDAKKVTDSVPDLLRYENLGILENEQIQDALAKKFGVPGIDAAAMKRLSELGKKVQSAPAGKIRNGYYQEMIRILHDRTTINPWDLLRDTWYGSVLARAGTFANVVVGSFATGVAKTIAGAVDAAVVQRKPLVAIRMLQSLISGMVEAGQIAKQIVAKGDYSALPDFEMRAKAILSGKGRGDTLETLWRSGNLYPGALAYVRRIMTALDYFSAVGARDAFVLYSALSRGDQESLEIAFQKYDRKKSRDAAKQAREELGPGASAADVKSRKREILEAGIDEEVIAAAQEIARQVAQNADPKGIPGLIYSTFSNLPWLAKSVAGLAFLRAAMNMVSNASDWYPGMGAFTWARSSKFFTEAKDKSIRHWLSLDLPPEQRRLAVASQVLGLGLTLGLAARILDDDEEDKWFGVSGPWKNVTPQQAKALRAAGERPNSIKLGKTSISYTQFPFAGPLAMIGHLRDLKKYDPEKYAKMDPVQRIVEGWMKGAAYIKDISALSGVAYVFGLNAGNTDEASIENLNRIAARSIGRFAGGYVPSVLKEVDELMDPERRTPPKDAVLGHWLRNFPWPLRQMSGPVDFNMLGDPVKIPPPVMRSYATIERTEPVYQLVGKWMGDGIFVPQAGKTGRIVDEVTGERRQMTESEYARYAQAYGATLKEVLEANISDLDTAEPEVVRAFLEKVQPAIQRAAMAKAFGR